VKKIVYQKKIPVIRSVDVLVCGGGFAGIAAAVAAARRGTNVMLIEHYGFLGGMATAAGISEFWASPVGVNSIFEEIREDLRKLHGLSTDKHFYDGEKMKFVLQEIVMRSNAKLRLHTRAIDAIREQDFVKAVIIHGKSSIEAVEAKIIIDATGDGDVACFAKAEFKKGRPEDGVQLPMGYPFIMWDTHKRVEPVLPKECEKYESDEDLPFGKWHDIGGGKIYCHMGKIIHHDSTDSDSLTEAEVLVRKQLMSCVYYVQTHGCPTFALAASPSQIGVREGRRIIGDYILTEEDIIRGRKFKDAVAAGTSQIDFHDPDRLGVGGKTRSDIVPPYHIPYRCLLVKDIDNMLTAGKCISGDQIAQSSYRMIPTSAATGQAAGTASAICVEQNIGLRGINTVLLKTTLKKDGIEFDNLVPFYEKGRPDLIIPDQLKDRNSSPKQ